MNENHQKLIRKYFIQKQSSGGVQQKKVLFEILQNSQENTCAGVNFIKKGTPAQVFSCEYCEISKNIFCCSTQESKGTIKTFFVKLSMISSMISSNTVNICLIYIIFTLSDFHVFPVLEDGHATLFRFSSSIKCEIPFLKFVSKIVFLFCFFYNVIRHE